MKKKFFLLVLFAVLCLLLSACSPEGQAPDDNTYKPEITDNVQSQTPNVPPVSASIEPASAEPSGAVAFKGFESLLEIPAGTEAGSIGYIIDPAENIGPAELKAISDDEFIILNSVNRELLFVSRDGSIRTISLENCQKPKHVAYLNGTIAILDSRQIVIMNENAEVQQIIAIPREQHNLGADVFDFFEDGKLYYQTYSDEAYMLGENELEEVPTILSLNIMETHAKVSSGGRSWIVRVRESPVMPIGIHGDRLLAITCEGTLPDVVVRAGIYLSGTDSFDTVAIDSDGQICPPILAMSPSGRVYMLTCFENHAVLSELVFE